MTHAWETHVKNRQVLSAEHWTAHCDAAGGNQHFHSGKMSDWNVTTVASLPVNLCTFCINGLIFFSTSESHVSKSDLIFTAIILTFFQSTFFHYIGEKLRLGQKSTPGNLYNYFKGWSAAVLRNCFPVLGHRFCLLLFSTVQSLYFWPSCPLQIYVYLRRGNVASVE